MGGGTGRLRPFRRLSQRSGCVPAEPYPPLSYSQSGSHQPRRATGLQRTATTPLTACLTIGVHFTPRRCRAPLSLRRPMPGRTSRRMFVMPFAATSAMQTPNHDSPPAGRGKRYPKRGTEQPFLSQVTHRARPTASTRWRCFSRPRPAASCNQSACGRLRDDLQSARSRRAAQARRRCAPAPGRGS